jgi:hypothetical protein
MSRLPALPQRPTRGIVAHEPECGMWEFRMVKGGPVVPARISRIDHEPGDPENLLDTGPILIANIGYREADPIDVWVGRRERVLTEEEYALRMAQLAWDCDFDPTAPAVQPRKPVDVREIKPIGPSE